MHVSSFFLLVAALLAINHAASLQVGKNRELNIVVKAINPGSPFRIDSDFINELNTRLGLSISPSALINEAPLFAVSSASSWSYSNDRRNSIGSATTFLELGSTASRSWVLLSLSSGGISTIRCEAVLRSVGAVQLLPFVGFNATLTTPSGIVARIASAAVGEVVKTTGCLERFGSGVGSVNGMLTFSAFPPTAGTLSFSDQYIELLVKEQF